MFREGASSFMVGLGWIRLDSPRIHWRTGGAFVFIREIRV
jgi:hypothetical protein